RYLAQWCNDCHTADYAQKESAVEEDKWLMGVPLGWRGPWGTTYASNLRLSLKNFSEDDWVRYARSLKTRPPMPYWALNKMKEEDLRSLYRFITHLGPAGEPMPQYVLPGEEPRTAF